MTNSPPSGSESVSFDRLHPIVQRWIWNQNWTELRDVQDDAIPIIMNGKCDVIISAATAGGKTEAAFLPVVSAILGSQGSGFKALYISPLKALINDQFRRLEDLCEDADIPVHKWHGDVSSSKKRKARQDPDGVVLITPESLEALFVRRGTEVRRLFDELRYVVIDELHAFIGAERGVQLQSLLNRLEVVLERSVPRIGLSATLGDIRLAAECLRPSGGDDVVCLESSSDTRELRVQVRGYVTRMPTEVDEEDKTQPSARHDIADHLFDQLRGSHNLVFAGARQNVELYADSLRAHAEELGVPNEFFPHHGSLARELREDVETRLKEGNLPTTAVCTTTLELGIDIGDVESVAQIGPPRSIAGLRQRLGRSGRRKGQPAILRVYVEENDISPRSHPIDTLRLDVVQSVAAIRLLVSGWCEPPTPFNLHLSTLTHQVMALIAQYGGISAALAYHLLCTSGPFRKVDQAHFADLLRSLGDSESKLIEQAPDGLIMLGERGERIVEHYGFYAVFETPEEYRVVANGKHLGVLPIDSPVMPESMIVFAGKRWIVLSIDSLDKVLEVAPAPGGVPPKFGGGEAGGIHDRLVSEMREVLQETSAPSFLSTEAKELLAAGRLNWQRLGLGQCRIIPNGKTTLLFPWVGSKNLGSLYLALRHRGIRVEVNDIALEAHADEDEIRAELKDLATSSPPDPFSLARVVENKAVEKYDAYLSDDLLNLNWASGRINSEAIPQMAKSLL